MNMKRLLTLFTASFLAFTAHSASAANPLTDDITQSGTGQATSVKSQSAYAAFKEDLNNTHGVGTLKAGLKNLASTPNHLYRSLTQGGEALHSMSSVFLWPKVPILAAQSTWNLANGICKAPLGITQTALGGTVALTHQLIKNPGKTTLALGATAALGYTLANNPELVLNATVQTAKAAVGIGAATLGATSFTASHLMELGGTALKSIPAPMAQWMGTAMSESAPLFSNLSSFCFSIFGK